MRLAVSGNGYTTATNLFLDANHLTASTAHTLMSTLEHSAAMAGHTAATFAASYDEAAHQGVCSLVDLTDALANLGRMTDATRRNHAYAEARAVVGHAAAPADEPAPPSYTQVALRLPPSAAGTHGAELPHWAAWILDHVEGFVWPDSDTDRLRATARAWRAAANQLDVVKTYCNDAAFSLSVEIAPDVELATDATRRLATQIDSLGQTLHGLGRSCDDLAEQVHRHRQQVVDIVHDTLRDAVVVEGIGLVLGAVTGGITAAAATSVNGARIAAIAPRIIRIIEALRIAIGGSETGARVAAEGITDARATFQAFLKARIIARSDRGAVLMPFGPRAADGSGLPSRALGWLKREDEAGAHVFDRHVGKSALEVQYRAIQDGLEEASSFTDTPTAEKAIGEALDANTPGIADWLQTRGRGKVFDYTVSDPVGIVVKATGEVRSSRILRVVLRRSKLDPAGFIVYTSYLL